MLQAGWSFLIIFMRCSSHTKLNTWNGMPTGCQSYTINTPPFGCHLLTRFCVGSRVLKIWDLLNFIQCDSSSGIFFQSLVIPRVRDVMVALFVEVIGCVNRNHRNLLYLTFSVPSKISMSRSMSSYFVYIRISARKIFGEFISKFLG